MTPIRYTDQENKTDDDNAFTFPRYKTFTENMEMKLVYPHLSYHPTFKPPYSYIK